MEELAVDGDHVGMDGLAAGVFDGRGAEDDVALWADAAVDVAPELVARAEDEDDCAECIHMPMIRQSGCQA